MIDNFIFVVVFALLPYFCWKAIKMDDEQIIEEEKLNNTRNKVEGKK